MAKIDEAIDQAFALGNFGDFSIVNLESFSNCSEMNLTLIVSNVANYCDR